MTKTILLSAAAMLVVTGCAQLERGYRQEIVTTPSRTETNVTTRLEPVEIRPSYTNVSTGEIVPPAIETKLIYVTNLVQLPPVTVTNLAPIPAVQAGIQSGVGMLPFPGAGAVGYALAAIYAAYATWRNNRTASTGRKVAKALVEGIEAGRLILNETPEGRKLDAKIKDELIKHQEVAGVLNEVSVFINEHTGNTVKTPA
ncbi:MAG: hypothetical protein SFY81_04875 [Verrucomicrobiota bacterium]|nr:hypothetical protein [Verrucomicrobiota bacterium]